MGKALKKAHITVLPNNSYFQRKSWSNKQLERWIANLGGTFSSGLNDKTTHLILDEAQWQAQGRQVITALNRRRDETKRSKQIKILTAEWLDEVMLGSKNVSAKKFDWTKVDPATMWKAKDKTGAKDPKRLGGANGTIAGMTKQVFLEETDRYMTEAEKKARDEELAEVQKEKELRKLEAELEKEKRKEDLRALILSRNRVLQNSVFAENWHVYRDASGFLHHVMLTKIDASNNRNERQALTIQIYESNANPKQYCLNIQHGATGRPVTNSQTVPRGTIFPTAFRMFKEAFLKFSKVAWDDRLSENAHFQVREREKDKDFHERSFRFTPPRVKKVAFAVAAAAGAAATMPIDIDAEPQAAQAPEPEVSPQDVMYGFLSGIHEGAAKTPEKKSEAPTSTGASTPTIYEISTAISQETTVGVQSQDRSSLDQIMDTTEETTTGEGTPAQEYAAQQMPTQDQDIIDAKPSVQEEDMDFGDFGWNLGPDKIIDLAIKDGVNRFSRIEDNTEGQLHDLDSFATNGEDELYGMFASAEQIAHQQTNEVDDKPNMQDKQANEDTEKANPEDDQSQHSQVGDDAPQIPEDDMSVDGSQVKETQVVSYAAQSVDNGRETQQSQISSTHETDNHAADNYDSKMSGEETGTQQSQFPHTQMAQDAAQMLLHGDDYRDRTPLFSPEPKSILGKRKASADEKAPLGKRQARQINADD